MFYNNLSVCEIMSDKQNKPPVHELQFNVAQLLKQVTGATRQYDITATVIRTLDEDVAVVSPLVGHVKFLRTGADILVTGVLETNVQKVCGRCLTTFEAPITIELEEEFHPTIDVTTGTALPPSPDADEANQIDAQHILDLFEVVRQDLLLESDSILYCRPDCLGLCPVCGQDRNTDPCDCKENNIDMRWAGLQALQIED